MYSSSERTGRPAFLRASLAGKRSLNSGVSLILKSIVSGSKPCLTNSIILSPKAPRPAASYCAFNASVQLVLCAATLGSKPRLRVVLAPSENTVTSITFPLASV